MKISETRLRIIEGASDLFYELGYSKVTVDEIALRAGCTKKTIYNHFPTKLNLLQNVIKTSVQTLFDEIEAIADDTRLDFLEKLVKILQYLFIQFTYQRRNLLDDFSKHSNEETIDMAPNMKENLVPVIQRLVDEGISKGLIMPTVSRELLPYTHLSIVWGGIFLLRRFNLNVNPGELLIESVKYTLGGVLTPKGRNTLLKKAESIEKT